MFPIALNPLAMIVMILAFIVVAKLAEHFGLKLVPGGLTLLVPDAGEVQLLTMALQKATVETQTLKLYVNNYTPVEGSIASNFTEMSTNGYAAKVLTRASWSISTSVGVSTASYPQQTWTFTNSGGANTVYGYYIIETTSTVILWAELFASAQVIQNTGDQILLTPKITLE